MKQFNLLYLIYSLICINILSANPVNDVTADNLFFPSPEASVPEIVKILSLEDWRILEMYSDLNESTIKSEEILSGDNIANPTEDSSTNPDKYLKFKNPIPFGITYSHHEFISDEIIKVWVSMNVVQDEDNQKELKYFFLIKSIYGYQILP